MKPIEKIIILFSVLSITIFSTERAFSENPPPYGPPVNTGKILPPGQDDRAEKNFNAWKIKLSGDSGAFFYLFDASNKYYDGIVARIDLKQIENGNTFESGALIFFKDDVKTLPPPILKESGKTIHLFYRMSEFPMVLHSLESYKHGKIKWEYYSIQESGDTIKGGMWGYILFE